MASKKETELELQLWQERAAKCQMGVQSLNLQAQILQMNAKECQDNVARLEAQIAADAPQPSADGSVTPIRRKRRALGGDGNASALAGAAGLSPDAGGSSQ
jgi:hypothetical protein